jgi:hypothetical protein
MRGGTNQWLEVSKTEIYIYIYAYTVELGYNVLKGTEYFVSL